jgi:hypothetical protein
MTNNVCLPRNHVLIIFVICISLATWYINNDKQKHLNEPNYKYDDQILDNLKKNIIELQNKVNEVELQNKVNEVELQNKVNEVELQNKVNEVEIKQPSEKVLVKNDDDSKYIANIKYLKHRDKEVLYNNFIAPERRQPSHSYPFNHVKNQLNISTRGIPDNYHLIGILVRDNTETAFNLFGRQIYPGSNQWEYYVQGSMHYTSVKIPIYIKGDREIEDGQLVSIPGYDASKGTFKAQLYKYDTPRYNPTI